MSAISLVVLSSCCGRLDHCPAVTPLPSVRLIEATVGCWNLYSANLFCTSLMALPGDSALAVLRMYSAVFVVAAAEEAEGGALRRNSSAAE